MTHDLTKCEKCGEKFYSRGDATNICPYCRPRVCFSQDGSDTADGITKITPVKSMAKAVELANQAENQPEYYSFAGEFPALSHADYYNSLSASEKNKIKNNSK